MAGPQCKKVTIESFSGQFSMQENQNYQFSRQGPRELTGFNARKSQLMVFECKKVAMFSVQESRS